MEKRKASVCYVLYLSFSRTENGLILSDHLFPMRHRNVTAKAATTMPWRQLTSEIGGMPSPVNAVRKGKGGEDLDLFLVSDAGEAERAMRAFAFRI